MEELVAIEPKELAFTLVFNAPIVTKLNLENKINEEVAFKVKTTHPKRYVVRPNAGVLLPKQALAIEIAMETVSANPPDVAACKDKFLVQVCRTKGKENLPSAEFWSKVPANEMLSQKFKVFLVPANPSTAAEDPTVDSAGAKPTPDPITQRAAPPPGQTGASVIASREVGATSQDAAGDAIPVSGLRSGADAKPKQSVTVTTQTDTVLQKRVAGQTAKMSLDPEPPTGAVVNKEDSSLVGIPIVVSVLMFLISAAFIRLFI